MEFLVLPPIVALPLIMPLLKVFANIVGILGGLMIDTLKLDITPIAITTRQLAPSGSMMGPFGLVKAVLFGAVVALSFAARHAVSTQRRSG